MKRIAILVAIIFVVGLGFIPYNTVLVPRWKVRVINEKGEPYTNKMVRQFCDSDTLMVAPCSDSNDGTQYTNLDGFVEFPERTISLSLYGRVVRTGISFLRQFAHGSFGKSIYIDASGPKGLQKLEYSGGAPPSVFVLKSE